MERGISSGKMGDARSGKPQSAPAQYIVLSLPLLTLQHFVDVGEVLCHDDEKLLL